MVRMPTRPKYIYRMMRYWAGTLSRRVVSAVRPTVARAEMASNRALVKPTGEVAQMNTAPNMARMSMAMAMVMASSTWLAGMVRRKAQTVDRPRSRAQIKSTSTTKVTVFSPPAVDPEEPPMSMIIMDTALPPSVSFPWSTAAKPAVRKVTDWKRPFSSFSHTGIFPRVSGLFHSRRQVRIQPASSRAPVVESTSRV